jgi:adenylate kinase
MNIILLGPPGAGKGTQAKLISEHFQVPTISTGDMLRAAIAKGSPLGLKVKEILKTGQLVPDSVVIEIVKARVSESDCERGFLLDGFPRTIPQAEALDAEKIKIDFVIEVRVPDELIVERLSGRRIHPASGRVYHTLYQPPQRLDCDDATGEALVQRDDDKAETVRKRLSVYHQQTAPLIHYYQKRKDVHYIEIDGRKSVDVVQKDILDALTKEF